MWGEGVGVQFVQKQDATLIRKMNDVLCVNTTLKCERDMGLFKMRPVQELREVVHDDFETGVVPFS